MNGGVIMPIIKSAKKKLRKDIKRTKRNKSYINAYKKAIDRVKKSKTGSKKADLIKKAQAAIDKAIKRKVIHKNKGSRLKSLVARMSK